MNIIVIGATGTLGQPLVQALKAHHHDVVQVGNSRGDYTVDLADSASIKSLLKQLAPFDALVSAAGQASFKPFAELTDDDFALGLSNKLMGQVNLVRLGAPLIADGGSFTLTGGTLSREPAPGSAAVSLVNAGLEGFVRAAALELPRGVRVNIVTPPWVRETLEAMGQDSSPGMPAADVAKAYLESVQGSASGQVIDARDVA